MKTITRRELYEMIWSITKTKTAAKLKLPYAELTGICKKYNIPTPTSNYWQRLAWKEEVEKTALPDPDNNPDIPLEPVVKEPRQRKVTQQVNVYSEILDRELEKKEKARKREQVLRQVGAGKFVIDFGKPYEEWSENVDAVVSAFPVPECLRTRREIVLMTKAYMRLERLSWSELERHPDYRRLKTHLNVMTDPERYDRALRLFDTVISIFEALGGKMKYDEGTTAVIFGDVTVPVRIAERNKRVEIPENERNWGLTYKTVPSGVLRFALGGRYSEISVEDTPHATLESKLDLVVQKTLYLVHNELEWRERRRQEEIRRKRAEEERRREEELRRRLEELKEQERREVRSLFALLRRGMLVDTIGRILEKYEREAPDDASADATDGAATQSTITRLRMLRELFDPCRTIPFGGNLAEADIDALADEFFKP